MVAKKLEEAHFRPREEINHALGLDKDGPRHANVEVKYGGPDGVIIDISESGADALGRVASQLAEVEGLHAHAEAARVRLRDYDNNR